MGKIDEVLKGAVDQKDVPFIVAMAGNSKRTTYSGAAGEATAGRPAAADTVLRAFSMSKAVASTAAMVLVDRGLLELDAPVEKWVPKFRAIEVLDRFDGDVPVLRKPQYKATIRQLATHTSGLEYEFWNGDIARYLTATGHPSIATSTKASTFYPMATDPGTRWAYGIGVNWLGLVIQAVDGRRAEQFVKDEILDPLGMHDTDVELSEHMRSRLADIFARRSDGSLSKVEVAPMSRPEIYLCGSALYTTARDYMRFLRMFLNEGALDGRRILGEGAVATMLADQSGGLGFKKMVTVAPAYTADFDPFEGTQKTQSFGFLRNEADIPGMRSAGSQSWAGICNTHYWFDPNRDVAGVILTQSLPFAEPRFMKTYAAFERAVYAHCCA